LRKRRKSEKNTDNALFFDKKRFSSRRAGYIPVPLCEISASFADVKKQTVFLVLKIPKQEKYFCKALYILLEI